jgi:hypothetical protein
MNDPKKLAAAALLAGGIGWAITGTANAAPDNPPAAPPDPCSACHVEPASADSSTDPLAGAAVPVTSNDDGPFETLFGDSGINTWTPTADTDLAALSPTLASDFATSVDGYETGAGGFYSSEPFTILTHDLDPTAFSANPDGVGLLPDTGIADLAVGLDYTVFSTGGYGSVDLLVDGLLSALGVPDLVGF